MKARQIKNERFNISMLKDEIEQYTKDKPADSYLFRSQKGTNHISTTQAYRILTDAADFIGY